MKNKLILLLAMFWLNPLMAQNDFKPGYIIKQDGDTLHGFIDLQSNIANSKECVFKESKADKKSNYSPSEIKGYRIEGMKYYVSRNVKIDSISKTLFLEYLVDGIADLYYLKFKEKDYYFIDKNGEMYEMTTSQQIVHYKPQSITEARKVGTEEETYYLKSNKYIGILNIAFGDCPDLKSKISRTSLSYGSLINLTKDYHEKMCSDYACIDYSKSTKKKIYIEPVAGVISSKLGLKTSKQTRNYTSYIVGMNVRILPLQTHYVWNLLIGVNYSQIRLDEIFRHNLDEALGVINPAKIKTNYSIIRIPISIEYTFPFGKLSPFLMGTFTNCFLVNAEYEVRAVYENLDGSYVLSEPYSDEDLKKFQWGLGGGAGLKYKISDNTYMYLKCDYEYRKSSSSTMEIYDYLKSKALIGTFGFGFRL